MQQHGGSGLGLSEASVVMEEINRSGGNSGARHGQRYTTMGTLLRHGSEAQKQRYLPKIASGAWRLQSMSVTEPGTDTTKIETTAVKKGDRWVGNGQKVWIGPRAAFGLDDPACAHHAAGRVSKKSEGLSIFMIDLREAERSSLAVRLIPNMMSHETNELFFENLEIPAENLIGREGQGFRCLLDGLNVERTLITCLGCRGRFERAMRRHATRPLDGIAVVGLEHAIAAPFSHAPARRPRRA